MTFPELYLKKNEDRRLRQGHLWVFSNEIDCTLSPLEQFSPGERVILKDASKKELGIAYINPHSLICARLLTRKTNISISKRFFTDRLQTALSLREQLFDAPFYRWVFGESDGLPGLVIDRYGDVLCVQITTAGMDALKPLLFDALIELVSPKTIFLKNALSLREMENLPQTDEIAYGTLPESILIEENQAQFQIDLEHGQKTGWFFDHRNSRAKLASLCKDKTVLDVFSYAGAWGIPAALNQATHVTAVDSSQPALDQLGVNAGLNGVADKVTAIRQDAFDFLKQCRDQNQHFDIIVLDPPALIKRKKDFKNGYQAYQQLNRLALQLVNKNGILISASCSHHLQRENLHEILRSSARHIDRHLTVFAQEGQGADHPIHPAMAETNYLKTFFCSVSPSL